MFDLSSTHMDEDDSSSVFGNRFHDQCFQRLNDAHCRCSRSSAITDEAKVDK